MPNQRLQFEPRPASLEAYLLGVVDFEACLALQKRLVYEVSGRDDGQIVLLLCEHPPIITVGRQGSRLQIRAEDRDLAARQLSIRWVSRGGSCLVHAPGQLAIYPIVPLAWRRWSVGEYLERLQGALAAALDQLRFPTQARPGRYGLWGRTGQLVAIGAAVRNWTTYHGAFLNVEPNMRLIRAVDGDLAERAPLTSLMVERQQHVKMSLVRATLLPRLAEAFDCQQHHVYTRHPLFVTSAGRARPARRVG